MQIKNKLATWLKHAASMLAGAAIAASAFAATDTTTYFHNDVSGTPMLATNAAGQVVWKETYRPYGEKLTNSAASANNKVGFAGKPYDGNTGLSYMGARYYDPVLGRFTGIDPKEVDPNELHSFNRYAYANNNPYKFVDPDGRSPLDVAFLMYDLGKLGMAIYSGVGVGAAAADVALSVVGVASPIPFAGQAAKAARVAEHGLGNASSIARSVNEAREAVTSSTKYTPGGKFSKATKEEAAERAGFKCEYCGVETVAAKKSERGVTPPRNEAQTDHIKPRSEGGTNAPSNAAHACRECNRDFSNTPKPSPRLE